MRKLSVVVLLAIAGLSGSTTTGSAAPPDPCVTLGGVAQQNNVCAVSARKATYTMDIAFPLNYADEQTLVDYITQNRDGFVNVAQTPNPRNVPYEMEVTSQWFTSGAAPGGTQSAVLKLFQDVGGAHPMTWYKAFTYNLGQRRPITFETLFAPWSNPLLAIFPIVQHDLERQTGLPGSISLGQGLDPTHYQNFAITDDAVIFFFGQGELLPSDAGATSVSVPRSAIPPLQL